MLNPLTLLIFPLLQLISALPTPSTTTTTLSAADPIKYLVTNFLYTETDGDISNLTFRLIDPRPAHPLNITCTAAAYPSHVLSGLTPCENGKNRDALFSFVAPGSLMIQRGWVQSGAYEWTKTDYQEANWKIPVNQTGTDSDSQRRYWRDESWEFIVTSAWM